MNRLETMAEVARRRAALKNSKVSIGPEPTLSRDLDELEWIVNEPDAAFTELWEQHELRWQTYVAELRRNIVRQTAHVAMAFEELERKNPHQFDDQPDVRALLAWWREAGREQFFGEITLAERQALEELERQWQAKNL